MSGARSRPDRVSAHSARPYVKPRPNALYRACRDALLGPCALARGSRLLVAVSGGPDSLALLHVLAELARTQRLSLVVAHLDHGVRGARGAADARFVARRARTLGLPCAMGALPAGGPADEATLRRQRHAFLARAARAHGCDAIALGHTADDQAETVLLRIVRGTGVRGLAAMRARNGRVVRPLLFARRAEVLAYLKERKLRPRVDETNRRPAYRRNAIRAQILPRLAHLNPRIAEALAGLAERAAELDAFVQAQAAQALESCATAAPAGQIRLVARKLLAYHRVVREAVYAMAVRAIAGDDSGLTRRHLAALEGLLGRGTGGRAIALPGPLTARLTRGRLCFQEGS
jgi:tRNA(Ile)-lysidine synthase